MRIKTTKLAGLLAVLTSGAFLSCSTVTAVIVPSVTSGVAPLAIFFDGQSSTDANTTSDQMFVEAVYSWNFGDTACASAGDTWAFSGKSKCTDMGPVAGHVYDAPGTYTAELRVYHGGMGSAASVQITVADPDTVYSGTSTTCVSTTSDFTGCPAGASQVTSSSSFSSLLSSYLGNGKRLLLHRGQSWVDSASYTGPAAGSTAVVGAFGTGAKPTISTTGSQVFNAPHNLTVEDISFIGNDTTSNTNVLLNCNSSVGGCSDTLLLRVDGSYFFNTWGLGPQGLTPGTSGMNHDISIVDSTSSNKVNAKAANDAYIGAEHLVFMGNQSGNEQGQEHDFRAPYLNGAVISHNSFPFTGPSNKAIMKVHNYYDGSPCTQGIEVADNGFDAGPNGPTTVSAFAPQDTGHTSECVRLVRIERNHFTFQLNPYIAILVGGDDMAIGNNIFDFSQTTTERSSPMGADVSQSRTGWPNPVDNVFYNNTCYESGANTGAVNCIRVEYGTSDTTTRNNLVYTPGLFSVAVQDNGATGTVDDHNLVASSNPFIAAIPTGVADFQCTAGSAPVDAGSDSVNLAGADFSGVQGSRLSGSHVDVGAWELVQ